MLEAEAKERWCPFARNVYGASRSDDGDAGDDCLCLGPWCMAWRPYALVEGDGYCGAVVNPPVPVERRGIG